MLVLTRKEHETIVLERGGERITVVVSRLGQGRVKLGIEAPDSWGIVRGELVPVDPKGKPPVPSQ